MKKIICIVFAMVVSLVQIGAKDYVFKDCEICAGSGYDVVYTIRGNTICVGSGYDTAYTIRGNTICIGSGYDTAYTIR